MNAPQKPNDWLEPPDWWKKWRPLRWLGGGVVVIALAMWLVRVLQPEATPPERVVVLVTEPSMATPAATTPPATATPSAVPTPAPATPSPTPVVAAEAAAEVADEPPADAAAAEVPVTEGEEEIYFEESLDTEPAPTEIAAFTRVEADPVRLLGSYRSYQNVDDVVFGLERGGYVPSVESRHLAVRDGMPPRNLDTVTVTQFRHWGVTGRLELQFFNDRLYQTEFEPEDAESYRNAQRRQLPQLARRDSGRSELISGHLRIASSLDLSTSEVGQKLRTRPFLIWQDRRLVRQREEWDRRFAIAAAP